MVGNGEVRDIPSKYRGLSPIVPGFRKLRPPRLI